MMNLQQGCKFVLEKYLYGAVCQDRLEKACLMDLFLFMDAKVQILPYWSWMSSNFIFDSLEVDLIYIG